MGDSGFSLFIYTAFNNGTGFSSMGARIVPEAGVSPAASAR